MSESRIGLALGSGSSRGWAHIGVLEVLEENAIPVDLITGTSIGAYVGSAYSAGGLEAIRDYALQMDWRGILANVDVVFPRSGFIDGKRVLKEFEKLTSVTTFEELNLPTYLVAANLVDGKQVVMSSGDLITAIRASISIPGVLTPAKRDGTWLIDGGVANPLPVSVAREQGATLVIAVDLNAEIISGRQRSQERDVQEAVESKQIDVLKGWAERYGLAGNRFTSKLENWFSRDETAPHILNVLGDSLNIMQQQITIANLRACKPDVLIQPKVGDLRMFDFDQGERAIQAGRDAAKQALPEIEKHLGSSA